MEPPSRTAIEQLAYQLWLERGCPIGTPLDDWNRAERLLNFSRKDSDSAPAAAPVAAGRSARKKRLPKATPVAVPPQPLPQEAGLPWKAPKA